MSKSEGEIVAITDSPQEIRRKVLDVDDGLIRSFFELCTEKEQEWIDQCCPKDEKPANPREVKEELAAELVRMYHGEEAVKDAEVAVEITATGPLDAVLKVSGAASSMSAAKKLIDQRGVVVNGVIADRWDVEIKKGDELKVGKGRLFKVK